MAQVLFFLISGAAIALVSSLVTIAVLYRLQMRRDQEEHRWQEQREIIFRWWERKADAYQALLGDLTGLANTLHSWIELESQLAGQADFLPEDLLELNRPLLEKYQDYLYKIHQTMRETGFLVSPEAASSLDELVHNLELYEEEFDDELVNSIPPRAEAVHANYGCVQAALGRIQEAARRDLKLPSSGGQEHREVEPAVRK